MRDIHVTVRRTSTMTLLAHSALPTTGCTASQFSGQYNAIRLIGKAVNNKENLPPVALKSMAKKERRDFLGSRATQKIFVVFRLWSKARGGCPYIFPS